MSDKGYLKNVSEDLLYKYYWHGRIGREVVKSFIRD